MPRFHEHLARTLAFVTLSGALAACSTSSSAPPTSAPSASPSAGAVASPSAASSGSLQTVNVGLSSSSPSNAGVFVADGLGYFADQGIAVNYVNFSSASDVMPALARGDLDVGDVGMNPSLFNAMASNISIKLVADKGSQPPGFGFTGIMVRKPLADTIKGPADLKGRTVAVTPPGLGTANGYPLAQYLAQAGLTVNDVDIQSLDFPSQLTAMTNGSIDVAIMSEPFMTQAANEGIAVKLIGLDQVVPDEQVAGLVYTDQFISQQHDLGVKWMTAYVRGIRAYNAAFSSQNVNKPLVVQILASKTSVNDPTLWSEIVPAGLNQNGQLNVQSISDLGNFFLQQGLIKTAPPVDSFLDTSFTDAADQALGPAPPVPTQLPTSAPG